MTEPANAAPEYDYGLFTFSSKAEVLDIEAVREDLMADTSEFEVSEVPYDPAQLTQAGMAIGQVAQAEGDGGGVEDPIRVGQVQPVPGDEGQVRLALTADIQHSQGEIRGHHEGAGPDEGLAGGTGTRRQVQDSLPRLGIDRGDHRLAPGASLAEGQDIVGDVITSRHPIEHLLDVDRLLAEICAHGTNLATA